MHLPKHFAQPDRSLAIAVMREPSFASLVRTDDARVPFETHLPAMVSERGPTDSPRHIIECLVANPYRHGMQVHASLKMHDAEGTTNEQELARRTARLGM